MLNDTKSLWKVDYVLKHCCMSHNWLQNRKRLKQASKWPLGDFPLVFLNNFRSFEGFFFTVLSMEMSVKFVQKSYFLQSTKAVCKRIFVMNLYKASTYNLRKEMGLCHGHNVTKRQQGHTLWMSRDEHNIQITSWLSFSIIECQTNYAMNCLRKLITSGHRSMDVKQENLSSYLVIILLLYSI